MIRGWYRLVLVALTAALGFLAIARTNWQPVYHYLTGDQAAVIFGAVIAAVFVALGLVVSEMGADLHVHVLAKALRERENAPRFVPNDYKRESMRTRKKRL